MALSKTELVSLVYQIADPKSSDDDVAIWMEKIIKETGCPHVGEYIFYSEPELSPEQVVEKALSYNPIQL